MVAFNFKPQFAATVETGHKRQTIRATKRCQPGDVLQLYTGQRTSKCRLLSEGVCTHVKQVKISSSAVVLDGKKLTQPKITQLAKDDGFNTTRDFLHFFYQTYELPFDGWVHYWRCVKPLPQQEQKGEE